MADTENATGESKRKRSGANALKQGYYAKSFNQAEAADLEEIGQEADLSSEIAMMRVVIRRVFEAADDCAELEAWVSVLRSLGAASTRLSGLLKAQKQLAGGGGEIAEALSQALREVTKSVNQ